MKTDNLPKVVNDENVHQFPKGIQRAYQLAKEKTAAGKPIFERSSKLADEFEADYEAQLEKYVLEALETKPDANLLEILLLTLPKLDKDTPAFYLTDLIDCAQSILNEEPVWA